MEVDKTVFEANPEMHIPKVVLVLHDNQEDLMEWIHATLNDYPEGIESGGITSKDEETGEMEIHLARDILHFSIIAHEVTHFALWHYAKSISPLDHVATHIHNHDEDIPYMVGNITGLLIYHLQAQGYDVV